MHGLVSVGCARVIPFQQLSQLGAIEVFNRYICTDELMSYSIVTTGETIPSETIPKEASSREEGERAVQDY